MYVVVCIVVVAWFDCCVDVTNITTYLKLFYLSSKLLPIEQTTTICCVHWIPFIAEKSNINCFIGQIRQQHWNRWPDSVSPINTFIHLAQLLPSRWALSFIEQPNPNATFIRVAFIALDSENLGEHVNDEFHNDFGDHKFPYFKHNKCSMQSEADSEDDEGDDEAEDLGHTNTLTETQFKALQAHLPASVLYYLCT